jgi:DNA-binding PadR family transcriptional regulator
MIRRIYDQSEHLFLWHEGTAYRVLHDLEGRGWVSSEWRGRKGGRRRRCYRIMEPGRRALREQRD